MHLLSLWKYQTSRLIKCWPIKSAIWVSDWVMPSRRNHSLETQEIWPCSSYKAWMTVTNRMTRLTSRTPSQGSWNNRNKAHHKWWSMFLIWRMNRGIYSKKWKRNLHNSKGLKRGTRTWSQWNQPSWSSMKGSRSNYHAFRKFMSTSTEIWTISRTSCRHLTSWKMRS